MEILVYGMIVINLIGLLLMGLDKRKASKNQWRIPERTLWIWAMLGAAPGMWFGMKLFRHKTKHLSFKIGLPLLTVLWLLIYIYLS